MVYLYYLLYLNKFTFHYYHNIICTKNFHFHLYHTGNKPNNLECRNGKTYLNFNNYFINYLLLGCNIYPGLQFVGIPFKKLG